MCLVKEQEIQIWIPCDISLGDVATIQNLVKIELNDIFKEDFPTQEINSRNFLPSRHI